MLPTLEGRTSTVPLSPELAADQSASPAILMVDDQPARLLTYEAILIGMPVKFVRANSGEEALQLLLKQSFALILLDVNMPGIDGYEVARHVRAHPRVGKTPIIFVSGERLTDLDRLKGYEVGAIDYISVPIVPEIMRSKVALLVELFHRRAELGQLSIAAMDAKRPKGASATHLRALFEQTTDMKFILRGEADDHGKLTAWRYVDVNPSALSLYNRRRDEVVGRTVAEVWPAHADRTAVLCQRVLLGGERLQHETEFASRNLLVRMFAVDEECVCVTCTDITDHKRIEHALANSERRFQALLEGCPVGVAQNHIDGRFEYVNAGFCQIVGYTAEELAGMTWQQITYPDDLPADQSRADLVRAGQLPHYTIEKRYIRKDGTPVWVSLFGNFIYDAENRPIQGVAVAVDITARKLADLALQESRQRLMLVHDAAGIGSFDWNILADCATWDSRAHELWGLPADATITLATALGGVHAEDRPQVAAAVARALAGFDEGRYVVNYRVVNATDGTTRWVESHCQALFENGVAVRLVGTIRDITARTEADQALRKSEERFRELANNIDQVVWTCDALGQPTWFNDRWYEFSGSTFEQMVNEGWRSLVHPDHAERVGDKFRRCIATGETWEETFPVRNKLGVYRWFLSRAIPIKNDDGIVLRWFGSNTDITEQRELQEALTNADRRKDEFLAMLAHELRNPIAPITSVSELLSRKPADPEIRRCVGIIQRQAAHLTRLLDDLLDVARITRGRIELRRARIDLNACVNLALETVEPDLRQSGCKLDTALHSPELFADADSDRLAQCVTNLLSNAIKYSPAGATIHVRTFIDNGRGCIEVRDTGRGISADLLPRIFDLFAQGEHSLDRSSGGLGIGLSVCKRVIEMHGGTIVAQSEGEGLGAVFTMSLPLANTPVVEPSREQPQAGASSRKVLIVDDNQDAADAISALLELSGYETRVFYEGESALRACAEQRPDVVLLDIGLPIMDGYEIIRRMRSAGYGGRAIALSGYGQPKDKEKALAAGFDAHFVKPIEFDVLINAVAEGAPTQAAGTMF